MPSPRLSLFKRSNNVWYVAYFVNNKRVWRSTRCTDRREALKVLRTLDLGAVASDHLPTDVNEFINEFLTFAHSFYQRKTYELYAIVAKRFAAIAGSKRLQDITPKTWDDYAVMRSARASPTTLNIEQRTLKAMMNRAVTWEYLDVSPFAKMKNVRLEEVSPKYFTHEEFNVLLSLIEEAWFRDAAIFAVSTGIRRDELVNLRWDDVDPDRRVITIQGHDDFRVKGRRARVVPLSSVAIGVIGRREKVRGCPYVFNKNGNKLWPNWITELFRWYVKKAGLWEKGLHWHSLRSSFASWLVSDGVSLYAVSRLLGHSTTTLTEKRYAHLAPETLHSAVELIAIGSKKR